MTDRELLELAAKAAGYCVDGESYGGLWVYEKDSVQNKDGEYPLLDWCPLEDDGDALRLAVKLMVNILTPTGDGDRAMVILSTAGNLDTYAVNVDGGDPYAATRRAIVRAAAEIGRTI